MATKASAKQVGLVVATAKLLEEHAAREQAVRALDEQTLSVRRAAGTARHGMSYWFRLIFIEIVRN